MRQFHTVVLERMTEITSALETEPYEVGWASEATLYVNTVGLSAACGTLNVTLQTSPDGINWVDDGSKLGPIDADGLNFLRAKHFGGWLRARFEVVEATAPLTLTVQLALKE